jgi:hypothetical protein
VIGHEHVGEKANRYPLEGVAEHPQEEVVVGRLLEQRCRLNGPVVHVEDQIFCHDARTPWHDASFGSLERRDATLLPKWLWRRNIISS